MNNQNTPGGRQGISNNQGQFLKKPKPIGDTKSVQRDANDTYGQWQCPNDKTINTGEYCAICGSRNPKTVEKKIVCSTCGYQNRKAATFCAGCGRNLSQPTGPETQKKSIPAGLTIGLIVGGCGILMAVCLIFMLLLGKVSGSPGGTTPPSGQAPAHTHSWIAATCTDPKTCSSCGITEGTPRAHNWKDATCAEPKTCRNCGKTEGSVLPHDWKDATCTQPATCIRCGETTGTYSHTWTNNSTDVLKTCSVCEKQVEFFYGPQTGELLAWTEYEKVNNTWTNPVSYSARDGARLDWDLSGEDSYQVRSGDGVHLFYVNGKMYYYDRNNRKMDEDIAHNLAVAGSRHIRVTQYLWDEDDILLSVLLAVDGQTPLGDVVGDATAVFDANGTQYVVVLLLDSDKSYVVKYNWMN